MDETHRTENGSEVKENQLEEVNTQDMVATNLNGQQPFATDTRGISDEEFSPEMTADDIDGAVDDEEFAAEMTADDIDGPVDKEEKETETGTQVNSAFGWIALSLSIISFFIMPIILGGAGIILGFISKSRGADTLGNTAVIAGAVSILITLFVLPFV